MIRKIISGGQTGADQAALDAAIRWNIPHGGWIPKGRLTETGRLPNKYKLKEMPTNSYAARTEKNITDSDGTLIISHGRLTGGSKYTQAKALKHKKPCLHIDLNKTDKFNAAQEIYNWVTENNIKNLNVAGPRESKDPYIYQATIHILVTVFHMGLIKEEMPDPYKAAPFMPNTVDEAVLQLISKMPLVDRISISKMSGEELVRLHAVLGSYIRNAFGLWIGNEALLEDCRRISKDKDIHEDDASVIIIRELWEKLKKSHTLRVVK